MPNRIAASSSRLPPARRPVGDIADHLDITPQTVSRHLKVLREAGLVDERREGTRHPFVVNPAGFSAVQEFLAAFSTEHLARLSTRRP
jgi:DNA-binding transcriptional ArsR family regulator